MSARLSISKVDVLLAGISIYPYTFNGVNVESIGNLIEFWILSLNDSST
jgi:hypothetical protein